MDSVGIPFDSDLIKCCPMCGVPIEKDEGCAQMMCKRCKHVFCWYCLASLDVSVTLNLAANRFIDRLLLCVSGRLPTAALRQRTLQKQTGPLACLRGLAPGAGYRNICRLRHPAAGRFTAFATGCAMYRVLQVQDMQRGSKDRGGARVRRPTDVAQVTASPIRTY